MEGTVLSGHFARSSYVPKLPDVTAAVLFDSVPLPARKVLAFERFTLQAAWGLGKGAFPMDEGPWGGCHGRMFGCHSDGGGGGTLKGKFGCHGN